MRLRFASILAGVAAMGLTASSALAFTHTPTFSQNGWDQVTVDGSPLTWSALAAPDGPNAGNIAPPTVVRNPLTGVYNMYYYDSTPTTLPLDSHGSLTIEQFAHATSTDGVHYTKDTTALNYTATPQWIDHGSTGLSDGFPDAPGVSSLVASWVPDGNGGGNITLTTWSSFNSAYGSYSGHIGVTLVAANGHDLQQEGNLWPNSGGLGSIYNFWEGNYGIAGDGVYGPDSVSGVGLTRGPNFQPSPTNEPHTIGTGTTANDEPTVNSAQDGTDPTRQGGWYANGPRDTSASGSGLANFWHTKGKVRQGTDASSNQWMELYYSTLGLSSFSSPNSWGTAQEIRYRESSDAAGVNNDGTWGGADGWVNITPSSIGVNGLGTLTANYYAPDVTSEASGYRRLFFASQDPTTGDPIFVTKVENPGVGDVNGDGVVDVSDLALVGAQWGTAGGSPNADVSGDGTVDVSDLAIVGANWANDYRVSSTGGSSLSSTANVTSVPLPSALGAALGLMGLTVIRRRRA